MSFVTFLRTPFLQNNSGRLLLKSSSQVLTSSTHSIKEDQQLSEFFYSLESNIYNIKGEPFKKSDGILSTFRIKYSKIDQVKFVEDRL